MDDFVWEWLYEAPIIDSDEEDSDEEDSDEE